MLENGEVKQEIGRTKEAFFDELVGKALEVEEQKKSPEVEEEEVEIEEDVEEETDEEEEVDDDEEDVEEEEVDDDEDVEKSEIVPKKPVRVVSPEGEEVKLSPETVVKTKIDGKWVDVPLHKMQSEYSGKVVVDRELTRAKQEVKKAEQVQERGKELQEKYQIVAQKIRESFNPEKEGLFDSISELAIEVGYLPGEFERKLFYELGPVWGELITKGEDFLEHHFLRKDQSAIIKRRDAEKKRLQTQRQSLELESRRLEELRKEYGLSQEEMEAAKSFFQSVKGREALAERELSLTPELVAQAAADEKFYTRTVQAIEKLHPEAKSSLTDGEFKKQVSSIVKGLFREPRMDDEDLEDLIDYKLGRRLKKVQKKREKEKLKRKVTKSSSSKKKIEGAKLEKFSDLDRLF